MATAIKTLLGTRGIDWSVSNDVVSIAELNVGLQGRFLLFGSKNVHARILEASIGNSEKEKTT